MYHRCLRWVGDATFQAVLRSQNEYRRRQRRWQVLNVRKRIKVRRQVPVGLHSVVVRNVAESARSRNDDHSVREVRESHGVPQGGLATSGLETRRNVCRRVHVH